MKSLWYRIIKGPAISTFSSLNVSQDVWHYLFIGPPVVNRWILEAKKYILSHCSDTSKVTYASSCTTATTQCNDTHGVSTSLHTNPTIPPRLTVDTSNESPVSHKEAFTLYLPFIKPVTKKILSTDRNHITVISLVLLTLFLRNMCGCFWKQEIIGNGRQTRSLQKVAIGNTLVHYVISPSVPKYCASDIDRHRRN